MATRHPNTEVRESAARREAEVMLEGQRLILKRKSPRSAKLIRGRFGRPVLVSARGAPKITTETVNAILDDLR
jgi:hypothetical protein